MSAQFDEFRDEYEHAVDDAIGFAGQEHEFFIEAKARRLLELAHRLLGSLRDVRALDVGCGVGLTDRYVAGEVGALEGTDVSEAMVERAATANPQASYRVYDGHTLPYEDGRFDLAFAINVLHHVEPPDRSSLVREMARVTRPGGLVTVFEHNPLNPLTRLVVARCAFDVGVELLWRGELERLLAGSGLDVVERAYLLFFPWRARALARVERALAPVPLGAQHVVAARRPASPADGLPSAA